MKLKQNNKGVILLVTFMAVCVLVILSGAYVASIIVQKLSVESQRESQDDFYAAQKGIEYAYLEVMDNPDFITHYYQEGDTTKALKTVAVNQRPASLLLSNIDSRIKIDPSASSNTYGCYLVPFGLKNIAVKVYNDINSGDTIILSRYPADSAVATVLKYRLTHKSLYKYFMFYHLPDTGWNTAGGKYSGKVMTISGANTNVGGIQVNGDIILSGGAFNNLSELSCGSNADKGQIYYYKDRQFDEPMQWDFYKWDSAEKRYTTSDSNINGQATIPRFEYPPYDFQYPLGYDYVLGLDGMWRGMFHNPAMHIYGNDRTNDWPSDAYGPVSSGWTSIQGISLPKILPACDNNNDCNWSWDKYYGLPNDNKVTYSWGGETAYNGAEKPLRFKVDNEALKWLIEKEERRDRNGNITYPNEYEISFGVPVPINEWLKTYDPNNTAGKWENNEYDRVTVLSIKKEPGTDGLTNGAGEGLNHDTTGYSEYDLYVLVKTGKFPDGSVLVDDSSLMDQWRDNMAGNLDNFFAWWKARKYHHRTGFSSETPILPIYNNQKYWRFSDDLPGIPAWERIFWEAWLNYWPPERGKAHSQIYTPAEYSRALNAEWWMNLVYGDDRLTPSPSEVQLPVKYLNTNNAAQSGRFSAWLKDNGLYNLDDEDKSVVKYAGHQGLEVRQLEIKVKYSTLARKNGLYIKEEKDGTWTVACNGIEVNRPTFYGCLQASELRQQGRYLNTWIGTTQFYNPYEITDPGYGIEKINQGLPMPTVKVIWIQMYRGDYHKKYISINNRIIYIESPNWDTYLYGARSERVNYTQGGSAVLPPGGFTLVSPYDVYAQAQRISESRMREELRNLPTRVYLDIDFDNDGRFNETDSYRNLFNYEVKDKQSDAGDKDLVWQPAAIITNSRIYFLSPDFKTISDTWLTYPYPYKFPNYPYSLRDEGNENTENIFIKKYCWPVWPAGILKPDTANWFGIKKKGISDTDQQRILEAGEANYERLHDKVREGTSYEMMNRVNEACYFNLAVASPQEARGYRIERWENLCGAGGCQYQEDTNNTQPPSWEQYPHPEPPQQGQPYGEPDGGQTYQPTYIYVQGAFLRIARWAKDESGNYLERYHSSPDGVAKDYEKKRFNLTYADWLADDYKIKNTHPGYNADYQYEERFWSASGRPSGDFLALGSEKRWQKITDFGHHTD